MSEAAFHLISAEQSARIDRLYAHLDRSDRPGVSVAVLCGAEVVYLRNLGSSNLEDRTPVTSGTIFRLGSTTKHFCATAILILESRGLLRLDDLVSAYVPMPACAKTMTLRHLLNMTSGLPDGTSMTIFAGRINLAFQRHQHMRMIARLQELMFPPGDQMLYSNSNYVLLSAVVEKLSGCSLARFLKTELFDPLGMKTARLTERMVEMVPNKAKGYLPSDCDSGFEEGLMLYDAAGDGGVDLCMDDFVAWYRNYRDDKIFGPDYRVRLEEEGRLNDGEGARYGLGMAVGRFAGFYEARHSGGMPGFLCDFRFYPEPDLGVLLLTNGSEPGLLESGDDILEIVTGAKPQRAREAPAPGLYLEIGEGMALEILETPAGPACEMLGDHRAILTGSPSEGWSPLKRGCWWRLYRGRKDDEIEVSFGGPARFTFKRLTGEFAAPNLSQYSGDFVSDILGETHQVRVIEGELTANAPSVFRDLFWSRLAPVAPDIFVCTSPGKPLSSGLVARFMRDAGGRVTALSYSTFRCRRIQFSRISP